MPRILSAFHFTSKKCLRFFASQAESRPVVKYTKTVNLPKTGFPIRLSQERRTELERNLVNGTFAKTYAYQMQNNVQPTFVLHDGPPYANGELHMGHAVNKILKDITLRQNVVKGLKVHFKLGWDCHGLPIELKAMSLSKSNWEASTIRKKSREFALKAVEEQKKEFRSWGVLADWVGPSNVYTTLAPEFITGQLRMFADFCNRLLVFRELKPVYWSPSSKTALAEAELEYDQNFVSPSVIVRLRMLDLPLDMKEFQNAYALVWTTTPWTLPSNQAVCFNPELEYSLITLGGDLINYYLIASNQMMDLQKLTGKEVTEIKRAPGTSLQGCSYTHPLDKKLRLPFLAASHVQDSKGTGLVHTAPAHGPEDFLVSLEHKLPVKCFVDESGVYTSDAPQFLVGHRVLEDGNQLVQQKIAEDIVYLGKITHSFPIDWRTKKPVIIRASEQWFINTERLREKAIEEIAKISIYPRINSEVSRNALMAQVQKRPYWCISRQRSWGVPIPVFYEKKTRKVIVNDQITEHICQMVEKEGNIDFWWSKPVAALIPENFLKASQLKAEDLEKGMDIFDIWFDSGSSWSSTLPGDKIADLYLEGYDQFTGWFQSSLLTSVACRNCAPYKSLFVHGFTVDQNGHKMSKSIGNVISPKVITEKLGMDTLRWWVASHGTQHMTITASDDLLQQSAGTLAKVRMMLRYLNGALGDKSRDVQKLDVEPKNLTVLDRYILSSLLKFEEQIQKSYDLYEYNRITANIMNFITNQISADYVHLVKDRLYCGTNEQVEVVKFVLGNTYEILCKSLWPIIPFMVEESWSYYDDKPFHEARVYSSKKWNDPKAEEIINTAFDVRRSIIRESGSVNTWLLKVHLTCNPEKFALLDKLNLQKNKPNTELCEIFQVADVVLEKRKGQTEDLVVFNQNSSVLCVRCRRFCVEHEDELCQRCANVVTLNTSLKMIKQQQ